MPRDFAGVGNTPPLVYFRKIGLPVANNVDVLVEDWSTSDRHCKIYFIKELHQ